MGLLIAAGGLFAVAWALAGTDFDWLFWIGLLVGLFGLLWQGRTWLQERARHARGTGQLAHAGGRFSGTEVPPESSSADELVTLFPWLPWSQTDTANARQMITTIFDKDPVALDSTEAAFLLETLEAGRDDKTGMFMVVPQPIAESLTHTGGVSMDPEQLDPYGRKRLPEIAKEIGLSQEVIAEMGWGWP